MLGDLRDIDDDNDEDDIVSAESDKLRTTQINKNLQDIVHPSTTNQSTTENPAHKRPAETLPANDTSKKQITTVKQASSVLYGRRRQHQAS